MTRVKYGAIAVILALLLVCPLIGTKAFGAFALAGPQFQSEYANYTEMLDAGDQFNIELASESFVLLKNAGNALPLTMSATGKKVSLFSNASYNHIKGGSGSGGGNANYGTVKVATTIKEGLESSGFLVNPTLATKYTTAAVTGTSGSTVLGTINGGYGDQFPIANLEGTAMEQSYDEYNGAAILTFSRGGGEFNEYKGFDVVNTTGGNAANGTYTNRIGHTSKLDHAYSLNDAEKELLTYVKGKFSKVVVLINSSNPMELAELQDDPGISAIMWIGSTGKTGAAAIGKVLSGEVNPSGRLVDVYHANFKKDPTWANFGFNILGRLREVSNGAGGTKLQVLELDGTTWADIDYSYTTTSAATPPVTTTTNATTVGASGTSYAQNRFTLFTDKDGNQIAVDGPNAGANYYASLDYEEGIYMGYRYYETANTMGMLEAMYAQDFPTGNILTDAGIMPAGVTDTYYNRYNGVVYPFGYGLSYTSFSWTVADSNAGPIVDKDGNVVIDVRVKNTGLKAGKDVIQVYSNPEYYTGGIEKASANLVEFAKTKLLKPGESELITIKFPVRDLASFDHEDKNANGFAGYELEAGNYKISLRTDSHNIKSGCELTYTVAETSPNGVLTAAANGTIGKNGFYYNRDAKTGAEIKPLFTGSGTWDGTRSGDTSDSLTYYDTRHTEFVSGAGNAWTELTRANMLTTFPKSPTANTLKLTDDALKILDSQIYYSSFNDLPTDPWYKSKSDIPLTWTQMPNAGTGTGYTNGRVTGERTAIQLVEMTGVAFEDPKWDVFMNQLTFDEMRALIQSTSFNTPVNNAIGKPKTTDADGPVQLAGGVFWCGEVNQSATYNVDLAYKQGKFTAEASKFNGRTGWYGPGLNTHRNPMAGRNFEYYSQDGVQGGKIAAAVIKAATDGGMVVYMKHLFLNDQESNRYNALTFVSEQAIREQYGKMWELAIKDGNANASMSAFNRMGLLSMSNYNLYQRLLKDEWGFKASTVTDMYGWNYNPGQTGDMSARVGITPLGTWTNTFGRNVEGTWNAAKNTVEVEFTKDLTDGVRWVFRDALPEADAIADPDGDGPLTATAARARDAEYEIKLANGEDMKTFQNDGRMNPNATGNTPAGATKDKEVGDINTVNRGNSKAIKTATANAGTMKATGTAYAKGDKMDSYTQWYAVRETAQKMLYVHANANTMRNGVIENPLRAGRAASGRVTLGTVTEGTTASFDLLTQAAFMDYRTDVSGHKLLFVVTSNSGALPSGVTLNQNTGIVSVANTAAVGNLDFTIRLHIDDWIGTGQATDIGNYNCDYRIVVAAVDTTISDIKARLDALEDDTADLRGELAALETKLAKAIADGDTALEASVKAELDALKERIAALEEAGCGSSVSSLGDFIALFGLVAIALGGAVVFTLKRRAKKD